MDRDELVLITAGLAGLASVTSIALALVVGYDRAKSVYWNWVVCKLAPLEYTWAAAQFAQASGSGVNALPSNTTLDGGPDATDHAIFAPAIRSLRRGKWYRGKLIWWKQFTDPDASGNRPWLCILHPEVYRRTRPDEIAAAVYR
jgi:hypothetical protein